MRTSLASLALLAAIGAPAAADDAHEGWIQDFDEAVLVAREQKKDLLVDFTGSDWCGWCIRLGDEVFRHDAFRDAITEDYVLVMLDFPRDQEVKDKVPNPERNNELKDLHGVSGFPTILLMTADGDVYGQTGYKAGGPETYVEHIGQLRAEGRPMIEEIGKLADAFEAASGEQKLEVWEAAFAKLEELSEGSPFARPLGRIVKAALALDADNEAGLKERACVALMAAGQYDDEVAAAVREIDPDNGKGLLEQAVEAQIFTVGSKDDVAGACEAIEALAAGKGIQDEKRAVFLFGNAAYWYANVLDDKEKAVAFARRALDAGAEGRTRTVMEEIIGR